MLRLIKLLVIRVKVIGSDLALDDTDKDTTTCHFLLGKEEKQLLFCIQYEPFILQSGRHTDIDDV